MTKQEFVEAVAGKTGMSKRDAGAAVDAFLDVVEGALKAGMRAVLLRRSGEIPSHLPQDVPVITSLLDLLPLLLR